MIVRQFNDVFHASQQLAAYIASMIEEVSRKHKVFSLAISGGLSASYYLSHLSHQNIDWNWVHIFWANERMVSPDSQHSNFKMTQQYLFDKIAIPHANIHRIKGELKNSAADDYENELKNFFNKKIELDLTVLGLNENGYFSSLYPDSPAVDESIQDLALLLEHPINGNVKRVSLTLPVINQSKKIILFITGDDKRDMFARFVKEMEIYDKKSIYPRFNREKIEIFTDIDLEER